MADYTQFYIYRDSKFVATVEATDINKALKEAVPKYRLRGTKVFEVLRNEEAGPGRVHIKALSSGHKRYIHSLCGLHLTPSVSYKEPAQIVEDGLTYEHNRTEREKGSLCIQCLGVWHLATVNIDPSVINVKPVGTIAYNHLVFERESLCFWVSGMRFFSPWDNAKRHGLIDRMETRIQEIEEELMERDKVEREEYKADPNEDLPF